jgi:hypothetical protein
MTADDDDDSGSNVATRRVAGASRDRGSVVPGGAGHRVRSSSPRSMAHLAARSSRRTALTGDLGGGMLKCELGCAPEYECRCVSDMAAGDVRGQEHEQRSFCGRRRRTP